MWLVTGTFAHVHPATASRWGGPDQPQAQASSQHEHGSPGGGQSKSSHGDAHQQHLPHCKETGREQRQEKKCYQKGTVKRRRWDQQQPHGLHLLLPSTCVLRDPLTHGWITSPGPAPCPSSHSTLGCSPRCVFLESQSILLGIKDSHQALSPRLAGTDPQKHDQRQPKEKEKRSKVPVVVSRCFSEKAGRAQDTLFSMAPSVIKDKSTI